MNYHINFAYAQYLKRKVKERPNVILHPDEYDKLIERNLINNIDKEFSITFKGLWILFLYEQRYGELIM